MVSRRRLLFSLWPMSWAIAMALLLAVLGSATVSAQSIDIVETREPLNDDERQRLIRVVQKALEFHAGHFQLPQDITLKITLFEDRVGYLNYQRENSSLKGEFGGFYSPSRQEIATHKEGFRWLQGLIHEAEHHVMHLGFPQCPIWLNEGLAEFFSTGYVRGSRIVFRPRKSWLSDVGKWRRLGQLPPIEDFFQTAHHEFNHLSLRTQGSRSYAIAYALVYFLMSTPENREILGNVLQEASQNGSTVEDAIDQHYPGGSSRLEHDWYRFLRLPKGNVVF